MNPDELREQIARATRHVDARPAWKRDILERSGQPTVSVPRPVVNYDEAIEAIKRGYQPPQCDVRALPLFEDPAFPNAEAIRQASKVSRAVQDFSELDDVS